MTANTSKTTLPEVFLSTQKTANWVSDQVAAKRARKIGPRLYTTNMADEPETIVRRNLWKIVALYCPGGLVTDRTAIENKQAPDGSVFVVSNRAKKVELPGLTISPRKGAGPTPDDPHFMAGLHIAIRGRAVLENMRPSRGKAGVARTLNRDELEAFLDRQISFGGEAAANAIRDEARAASEHLGMAAEMNELDQLIGTLLGSRKGAVLSAPAAIARAAGEPYDRQRIDLFEMLRAELSAHPDVIIDTDGLNTDGWTNLAFFEAYFSNFIEGTEFEVDEAADIVFNNRIPEERPADAHDVMGTFQIVSSRNEMSKVPSDVDDFVQIMQYRHATIMSARPEKRPGQFKEKPNRVGSMQFVIPDLLRGTLKEGFEFYQSLRSPFARAVFMMFLVSETHPFDDGNGRTARIMMNAELVAAGQQKIIIPIVYRNNYGQALRALSTGASAEPLLKVMTFAQEYASRIPWNDRTTAQETMTQTNAFMDPMDADNTGLRLVLPSL